MLKNPILSFVVIFFATFTILKLPFHGIEDAYDDFIVKMAISISKSRINDNREIKKRILFDRKLENKKQMLIVGNLDLLQRNENGKPMLYIWKLEMKGFAYLPLILLIALIAASPVTWKRKLFALLASIIFFHIFIGFKFFIIAMTAQKAMIATELGYSQFFISIFQWFSRYFITESINPSIMISLALWIVVTFRIADANKFKTYYLGISQMRVAKSSAKQQDKKAISSIDEDTKNQTKVDIKKRNHSKRKK